jgi:hypothetical protein
MMIRSCLRVLEEFGGFSVQNPTKGLSLRAGAWPSRNDRPITLMNSRRRIAVPLHAKMPSGFQFTYQIRKLCSAISIPIVALCRWAE